MKRRVVITGLGAVTPIGNTVNEFWNGIKEEKVGIGEITKFDTEDYKVKIAAEVKDFNVKERLDNKAARRMEVSCDRDERRHLWRRTNAGGIDRVRCLFRRKQRKI